MTNDDIKFYRGVPIDMHVKNCEAVRLATEYPPIMLPAKK